MNVSTANLKRRNALVNFVSIARKGRREKGMLTDEFMKFLKEQDPLIPCGIHKGWLVIDEAEISIDKLETFLYKISKKRTIYIR